MKKQKVTRIFQRESEHKIKQDHPSEIQGLESNGKLIDSFKVDCIFI